MKKHQQVFSIFWMLVGVYFTISGYRLGIGSLHKPGPGLIFFLAALLLTILSIIDLVGTFRGKSVAEEDKKKDSLWSSVRWQKVLIVLGGLLAYACFLNILGFLLSTSLLMFFLYKVVEPTGWLVAGVSSISTILFSYLIFEVWLKVSLPVGFLGF